ncbi:hypothetical protein KKG61_06325 [bacterium]|nr:hypothetical protein [bacterium]MBU1599701.1 hypothetical protein [bacterium]MBU2461331.1 hypothetical protein [bacterium]
MMKVERIPDIFLLIPILITSFLLNIWGIDWGVPSSIRNKLYFENQEQIKMTLKGVTMEKVRESQTTKELKGSRFNPVRSYHRG